MKWKPVDQKPYRVIICGDREWSDYACVLSHVKALVDLHGDGLVIAHGACRGADMLADRAARACGIPDERIRQFPVTSDAWRTLGRKVGPLRNRRMLAEVVPDFVLAFHNDIESSKGTKDMVSIARLAFVSTSVVSLLTTND